MAKRLEKDIEKSFGKWLENTYGKFTYLYIKLSMFRAFGRAGLPDRLILGPNKFILFIEFKRPGEPLEPLQKFYRKILKGFGFNYEVCDDAEKTKRKFLSYL